ncbi:EAL domain-containing response regulator [Herbaspirillum lusitanum]|uniref:EAL domain-containing response regulator n=1 Tax=Herbaspirillum lusitanum TaxID=213312 RepID=A0ABW9AHF7_9BURK
MKSIADLSIMVIEDEPFQRAYAVEKIRALGAVDILEAEDGAQATDLLKEHAIDLVFCDIGMPHMDGPQFVLAQRDYAELLYEGGQRDLPMLVWMSAFDGDVLESHQQMASAAGFPFVETISKPLSTPTLICIFEMALALINSTQERRRHPSPHIAALNISDDDILRAICDTNEFEVWYQPQLSLQTREILGAEAMVRWNHPKFSYLMQDQFRSLIEHQGLGLVLFYRTVNHALKTQQKLKKMGCTIPICVKVSALTLETREIADYLLERVTQHDVMPEQIIIGMSESEPPMQPLHLAASLNRLRIKGFGLSIDDFGVGLSTMKLLSEMPFTEIRIDAHFVQHILCQTPCRVIVEAIIGIASKLGLKLTAQGVDLEKQAEILQGMGCHRVQGDIAHAMQQGDFLSAIGASKLFKDQFSVLSQMPD